MIEQEEVDKAPEGEADDDADVEFRIGGVVVPKKDGGIEEVERLFRLSDLTDFDHWMVLNGAGKGALAVTNDPLWSLYDSLLMPDDLHVMLLKEDIVAKIKETHEDVSVPKLAEIIEDEATRRWRDEIGTEGWSDLAPFAAAAAQRQIGIAKQAIADMMIVLRRAQHGAVYLAQRHFRHELFDLPADTLDDLFQPSNIRVVARGALWRRWQARMLRQSVRTMIGIGALTPKDIRSRIAAAHPRASDEQKRALDRLADMLPAHGYREGEPPYSRHLGITRRCVRRARRALRRSVDAYGRLFGPQARRDVLGFLSGREMVIRASQFDWRMTKTWNAVYQGIRLNNLHCPFSINLHDKETGDRLASICVYFDQTPMVDLLSGIALHLRSRAGEERLIGTGNLYSVTASGLRDPILNAMKPTDLEWNWPQRVSLVKTMLPDLTPQEEEAQANALPAIYAVLRDTSMIPPRVFDFFASPPITLAELAEGITLGTEWLSALMQVREAVWLEEGGSETA